ncbi:MAG: hypothetical protein F4Z32_04920 [Gemmatimonadetes bacterium]|nr:hypothetical protein [Gemmatimonadota bacterium]
MKRLVRTHTESHRGWRVVTKHYEEQFLSGVHNSVEVKVRPGRAVLQKMPNTTYSTPHSFDSIGHARKWIDESAPQKEDGP